MLQNKLNTTSNQRYHIILHLSEESILNEIFNNIQKLPLETNDYLILLKQINFVIPSWILFVELNYNILLTDISNTNKESNILILSLYNVCYMLIYNNIFYIIFDIFY